MFTRLLKLVCFSSLLLISGAVCAQSANWQLNLQAGIGKIDKNDAQYVSNGPLIPNNPDRYSPSSVETAFIGDAGVERNFVNNKPWFANFAVGLHYNFSNQYSVKGDLIEFNLPQFNNYTYEYDVQHHAMLATLTDDIYHGKTLSPFMLLGVGVSLNTASGFGLTPKAGITTPRALSYQANTKTQFAWEAGLGLRYTISNHYSATLSYVYADMGDAKLGANNFNESGLEQHLHYQTALLGIIYRA